MPYTLDIPRDSTFVTYAADFGRRTTAGEIPPTLAPHNATERSDRLSEKFGDLPARRFRYNVTLSSWYSNLGNPEFMHFEGLDEDLAFDLEDLPKEFDDIYETTTVPPLAMGRNTDTVLYTPGCIIKKISRDCRSFAVFYEDGHYVVMAEETGEWTLSELPTAWDPLFLPTLKLVYREMVGGLVPGPPALDDSVDWDELFKLDFP